MIQQLIDTKIASTAIEQYTIVALDGMGGVRQAARRTDILVGTSTYNGATLGSHADFHRLGVAKVKLGGAVAMGDEITSNEAGLGVAVPASGGESVGRADTSGVAGDIIPVFLGSKTILASE